MRAFLKAGGEVMHELAPKRHVSCFIGMLWITSKHIQAIMQIWLHTP